MSAMQWLGLIAVVVVIAVIIFAWRQGMRVKPDKNRKTEDWPRITLGGSS